MTQYIPKSALVAEIEKRIEAHKETLKKCDSSISEMILRRSMIAYQSLLHFINTLEVKDPNEQCVQYDSIKAGIKAHAETYSFNIESELFNQLTPEQQKLWRKEIEQACISGGEMGVELARDTRYKENLGKKEMDLDKELNKYFITNNLIAADIQFEPVTQMKKCAKHFFELGMRVNNPITAADRGTAEEIIVNLKRIEQDYHIDLTKEMEWVRNKVQKGE